MLFRTALAVTFFAYAHHARASEADAASLCRGDAFRLCMSEIPDRERIIACMQRRKAELSPGCRTVFKAPKRPAVVETAHR